VKTAAFMQRACDLEDGYICMRLGLMYDLGLSVPKDTARANVLFKKGCLFHHADACKMVRR
jgi:TPR repeat protein